MTAQAWDAKGNTTVTSIVFYRNTQMTVLPVTLPSAYTMPHITDGTYINQGGEGACAAFTVASAYAIDRYNKASLTGGFNGNNIYSPEWIYNISLARGGFLFSSFWKPVSYSAAYRNALVYKVVYFFLR